VKSKRLNFAFNLIPKSGGTLWDLFSDHAKLIIHAANKLNYKKFIAVDQIEAICKKIENTISTDIPLKNKIIVQCIKSQELRVCEKNVFLLLGVGSNTIIETLEHILAQASLSTFIICAHKNPLLLREYLYSKNLNFIDEYLMQDRGKYYEFIVVNNAATNRLTPLYGNKIWHSPSSRPYLDRQLNALQKSPDRKNLSKINYLRFMTSCYNLR
jgi:tRNA A22 N-methylase